MVKKIEQSEIDKTEKIYLADKLSYLVDIYLRAKDTVIERGFAWEVDWQAERRLDLVNECDFLRESAWTVLSTGFRESVVRRLFGRISEAFFEWISANEIHANRDVCRSVALNVFGNERKINAILKIAEIVAENGFETIRGRVREQGVLFLQTLPYIGSITAFHLAKNLGVPVVKPDRHLLRIAKAAGFESPHSLCKVISDYMGDPIQVIDIVLWRYATLSSNYESIFSIYSNQSNINRRQ